MDNKTGELFVLREYFNVKIIEFDFYYDLLFRGAVLYSLDGYELLGAL
jgi:hypothetical protein